MQTGYGLMTWADGRRYEGYWVNSKCTGFGILAHKDGRRYEGEYVNDKMQGQVCKIKSLLIPVPPGCLLPSFSTGWFCAPPVLFFASLKGMMRAAQKQIPVRD
jgi:hypothetical protein